MSTMTSDVVWRKQYNHGIQARKLEINSWNVSDRGINLCAGNRVPQNTPTWPDKGVLLIPLDCLSKSKKLCPPSSIWQMNRAAMPLRSIILGQPNW